MPLYEYVCDECNTQFEVLRSASDTEEVTCPECDAQACPIPYPRTGVAGGRIRPRPPRHTARG